MVPENVMGKDFEREDNEVDAALQEVTMSKDVPQSHTNEEEDLSKLTVPALKDRLRGLGLPVGGRKVELIERLLQSAVVKEEHVDDSDGHEVGQVMDKEESNDDDDEIESHSGDGEDSILMNILDDILDDLDDENEEVDEEGFELNFSQGLMNHENNDSEESTDDDNNNQHRRARRKKYWKTQEVRDLLHSISSSSNSNNNYDAKRATSKAEEMISSLQQMAVEEDDPEYLPGPVQYALLIDAYAKCGTEESVRKAEGVIDHLFEQAAAAGDSNVEGGDTTTAITNNDGARVSSTVAYPTAQMLNAMMGAYATIGTITTAQKATTLLERMEYLKEFGGSIKPTIHSYSICISAWGKTNSVMGGENAEKILDRLFEDYEEEMLRLNKEEEGDGEISIIEDGNDERSGDSGGDSGGRRYADELKPNNVVFNSVIDAWARSGSPDAGEKAEALLHRMETLSHMEEYDVRPDTISFNTCIKAWCNSNRADAPLKAEEVLSKLEQNPQYPKRKGGTLTVRPNRLSYNTVINAWAKSDLPESALRAEGILLRMIKSFKSEAFATISPDSVTFASVLNALAKSRTVRFKAEKCNSILKAMIDLHEADGSYDTMPNIICYNTVLNACAFSARGSEEERRRALAVAVETFNHMRHQGSYVKPDAVSYGNMLKSCANLMPPGDRRNSFATRLFASCCDEGLVGGMCLDEIRRCIPPRAFLPLLADCGYDEPLRQRRKAHSVQLRELPREWMVNVKRGDLTSRQRGSFEKPKNKREGRRDRRSSRPPPKAPPVIRRPGLLIEYGASGKDL